MDIFDKAYCPSLSDIAAYVRNPLFQQFCEAVQNKYACTMKIEFSSCSWKHGWNVKCRKAGKTLCTIYPAEGFFTVMVVVGPKQKEAVEHTLSSFCSAIQDIYHHTKEGNGQRWLMIDLEDRDQRYLDTLRLIDIRRRF